MSKPKVSYPEFVAAQMTKYQQHSISYACEWRVKESMKPGARKLCDSLRITLRRMQRETDRRED
jgi:hypothetical protein